MREIKFRAWDKDNGEMKYNTEQAYKGHWQMNDIMYFGQLLDNPKYEVMQYIEMKDRNNKEIYEGDIVRCWSGNESEVLDYRELVGVVEYQAPYWGVQPQKGCWNHLAWNAEYVEIIGNVYENKVLVD